MNATQIHVFDTYARCANGRIMHFDVVTLQREQPKALEYARQWLRSIGEESAVVNAESCAYCHSEATAPQTMLDDIIAQGYAIYKMEGCPP
ncbi:DUF2024 family protein [Methylogaea oryzae]|uniref:DUF2024 family protein n=1 Tax=Methylogaea oryzae TaxID=1295382 RepID=A0A8D5AHJ3_9GAMM|nr:DUF2024 family protein [Methylogaea oryzae]BBL71533.1 hypothetical protein MoryE10_21390 [Methylogaea oryzae]